MGLLLLRSGALGLPTCLRPPDLHRSWTCPPQCELEEPCLPGGNQVVTLIMRWVHGKPGAEGSPDSDLVII